MNTTVFVYGTLKRGKENHGWIADQQFITEARTAPLFRIHDLGGYPGMVRDAQSGASIEGELWSVTPEGLARLDVLEDIAGGEYERVLIPLDSGDEVEAYLYLRDVSGRLDCGVCW